ncbi:ATPase, histidine kinase-, DNA gyrase B (macronuclear) [Tetrahymena thermophila SB210]|uniref:ATPase, histidine kinase-, DNA gyrase B n=1 Tax=Tetrahymena thermophila (strain SB210) TaxID=312017 RepID=I7ME46_TETTS|nr:ATPase, histidine kinase-, DNA gyrase B [Tetrahymena thermophila SB210]EAR94229.2 ATPase, histidine kinase-, DNA gyrase B [Tetrahymena thermophila SB210]|eukprot:XP_001014474.2 ATPase, histidine kinase-, DNA gyrase B [Tetrahymena thermophila SB210]
MQAKIEHIQQDNILNKFFYFADYEDEQRYSKYYLQQHNKMMYLVYIIVFCVNLSVIFKLIFDSEIKDLVLLPIFINQILVIVIIISIKKQRDLYNKLSCLINILFAIEVFFYERRFKSSNLNDYYQLCGFIIYGSHNSLMLSSQILYDSLGLVINFSIYTYQLYKSERIIEVLLMWCIIIVTIYQKFQHHKFTRFLYVSMQHQQEWIDVIENVLPSAIISIQQGKSSTKSQSLKNEPISNQQSSQLPQEKPNLVNNISFQKQKQTKSNQHQGQTPSIPLQTLLNANSNHDGQQIFENEFDKNIFKEWNLNLVNGQSKEIYSIKDMNSFFNFAQNVLIDTKELVMETSTAVNGNISSPLHPFEINKQLDQSNSTNNQANATNLNQLNGAQKISNISNHEHAQSNINIPNQLTLAHVNNNGNSIAISPVRYSLKGHTQTNFQDLTQSKMLKKINNNEKSNQQTLTENHLNNQGQVFSGLVSLHGEGGSSFVTLYKQLQTLVEEYTYTTKKPKFFIWKLNGKYYPPQQEKGNEQNQQNEKNHQEKNKEKPAISIQIKVCGFRGKYTRIVLCVDDISISEKIQMYQSYDKYKDLVLANAAHDLRQPLTALNYTILEAKKLFKKLKSQNIYSFLYQYHPDQFYMLAELNPDLNNLILNNLTTSKINQAETIIQQLQNNYQLLGVKPTLAPDSTDFQMIFDLLEMADVSGSSLKYLINDILDHAKLREGKLQVNFKECLLSQIIQFTKKMFDFSFKEKGIKYRIINQADLASDYICTDQQRLQQVLVNLISNSLKFTPSNKYIILHITKVIKQVHNREVSLLKISVLDQGCGMSSEQLQQIFKPYVSFNNNNLNIEGIGLGLNICRSIIGLLGPYPKLYVKSKQNEGTKFSFYIYHQLRKGSTTNRPGMNKKLSQLVNNTKKTINEGTKNTIDNTKKEGEIKTNNHVTTSLHKGIENDLDQITTKRRTQHKKLSNSLESFNDVIEKNRVQSIIDNTSRSYSQIELKENNNQNHNHNIEDQQNHQQIKETLNVIDCKQDNISHKLSASNDQEQAEKECNCFNNINESIDGENNTSSDMDNCTSEGGDEDDERNSKLNMTSIIMQLPDLDEQQSDQEIQSPLSKPSRRNLLQKYSQTGTLINPISTLNTQNTQYNKSRITPKQSDNINSLNSTFQNEKKTNLTEDNSFMNINTNKSFIKEPPDFYNSKRDISQDNIQAPAHNVSFNNALQSDCFLINKQQQQQNAGTMKLSIQQMNSTNALPVSGQFYPAQSNSNNTNNTSLYSFSNQNQLKNSQYVGNQKEEQQNQQENQVQNNIIMNYFSKQNYNFIDSQYSYRGQSKPAYVNSAFMPAASSQMTNNSFNNTYIHSTKTGSVQRVSKNLGYHSNNSSSNNLNNNMKQKLQYKNLPPILTQFKKKYPNALNEMDQSTGSFVVNNQKEELQVLIADDDPFNISILKMMLKKSDQFTFQIKDCNNGSESLSEFQKRNNPSSSKAFSLVISDIHMPVMDGFESTKQMRKLIQEQSFQKTVFIGVSGMDQETIANDPDLKEDFKVFDVVLSKPFNEQEIINTINQYFLDFY